MSSIDEPARGTAVQSRPASRFVAPAGDASVLHAAGKDAQDAAFRRAGRRALCAAFLGFFVDMFDVYLPIVVLGPAMAYFQPDSLSPALQSTLYTIVFALSLAGRPLGAALFGHWSDKIGRRKATIVSMAGFALVTFAIGLLPGYAQWGLAGAGALIFLRFVDGIFLGGEYTSANPLAMEYAPKELRGAWSALIHTGFPVALVAMSALTLGLLRGVSDGPRHAAYLAWGWRIPFFLGALFAFAVFLYYLRSLPESAVWSAAEKVSSPLAELFRGANLRIFAQVFLVMSGIWFLLNAVTSILPGVLLDVRHVDSLTVTWAQLVAGLALAFSFVPCGILGQKIGRRRVLWLFGLAGSTACPALYYLLVRSGYRSTAELILLTTLLNVCAISPWSIITAYLSERFPTGVRASGFGVGYSAAILVPAFSSLYMLGLRGLGVAYEYTEIPILAFGGLLMMIGALLGPETREVDIS
jgi:MFS family permease